jgi:dTDP-4-amino-4,6-dideoxygalactose transaminase
VSVRTELDQLQAQGYKFDHTWQVVDLFEKKVAEFFGAPYAIATDCCTHALELSLRLLDQPTTAVQVPLHTYMSVPMMLEKIRQPWQFVNKPWQNQYYLDPLPVVDSARVWKQNSYVSDTLMCLSFQFKKHIPIGRGGMILTDNSTHYNQLQKLVRDGRDRTLLWTEDDVECVGYHYYMTPEDAARGILLFDQLHAADSARTWGWQDYKPLTEFSVFKNHPLV